MIAGAPFALVERAREAGLLDLAHDAMLDLLAARGALLIRGFPPDIDAFRRFSDRFCAHWVVNEVPNRAMIDPAHTIQSVDVGTKAFPLHSEISRAPWRPDACFFHCLRPPAEGGETLICDGAAVAAALPEEVREGLGRLRLVYKQKARKEELAWWLGSETPDPARLAAPPPGCPFVFVRGRSGVYRIFSRPALQPTLSGGAPAFANFLLFARDMHRTRGFPALSDGREIPEAWVDAIRATCAKLTAAIAWRAGDLLVLDNSRFMHGRNAIADAAERVIASRFGYLRDAPPNPEEPADPVWRRARFIPPGTAAR